MHDRDNIGTNATLSARQSEIAFLIASGKSTREIAESLLVSPRTVEKHVQGIFERLGIRSRVELATLVVRSAVRASGGAVRAA